ncbi:hypothetical protein [Bacillus thuringiensis]|uniref:hypothetical protein n=1 Tax=Bacillus thuringiensis TaxID=1428 RepID=UPI000CD9D1D7|nr:hypothetical protein [Bacillus thuringiensis]
MKDIYELLLQVDPFVTEVEEKPCTEYEKLKIKESLKRVTFRERKMNNQLKTETEDITARNLLNTATGF